MRQQHDSDTSPGGSGSATTPPPGTQAPNTIVLTGFVGACSRPAYTRLYLESSLRNFIEMPDADICHREQTTGKDPSAGLRTTLWIRRGALLDDGTRSRD